MVIGSTDREVVMNDKKDPVKRDQVQSLDRNANIVLASEEVTRRNVEACVNHANETRKMFRLLEQRVDLMENTMRAFNELLNVFQRQLATLQQRFYAAGTTRYVDGDK